MLFVGDDWAEEHHDVEVQDESGRRLGKMRLPEGVAGLGRLHELIGRCAGAGEDTAPGQVLVGIETDRGPWVAALAAAVPRVGAALTGWNRPALLHLQHLGNGPVPDRSLQSDHLCGVVGQPTR